MATTPPGTYQQWLALAEQQDLQTGGQRWRAEESSTLYDHKVIRRRHDELVSLRSAGDPQALLYYLHEGVHGNMGGMGSPRLYTRARAGTKHLISAYIEQLVGALNELAALPDSDVSTGEKLAVLRRTGQCFGRSALMLSGAGSLGPFHMGVVRALAEQELLPGVLSGASAGAMVAAVAGTHTQAELVTGFGADAVAEAFSVLAATRASDPAGRLGAADVRDLIASLIPDLTFEEAFEHTGRYVNISVAPAQVHQRSRLLNAITSPNVYLREAVLASCAVPGIFPPVTLAARDAQGQRKAYVASRQWMDGSITDDMPARRLGRLYGVNHFISSQTNPLVLWAVQDTSSRADLMARMIEVFQGGVRNWAQAVYPFAMDMAQGFYPWNLATQMTFAMLVQQYTADINILPHNRRVNPARLLAVLSKQEVRQLVRDGEQSTWPKMAMIRNCTAVSRNLDRLLAPLESRALAAAA